MAKLWLASVLYLAVLYTEIHMNCFLLRELIARYFHRPHTCGAEYVSRNVTTGLRVKKGKKILELSANTGEEGQRC